MKIEGIHAISALDGLIQPPPAVFRVNPAIAQAKLVQLMTQFHWPQLFTFSFYEAHQ